MVKVLPLLRVCTSDYMGIVQNDDFRSISLSLFTKPCFQGIDDFAVREFVSNKLNHVAKAHIINATKKLFDWMAIGEQTSQLADMKQM